MRLKLRAAAVAAFALLLGAAPAVAQTLIPPAGGGSSFPLTGDCGTVTLSTPCLIVKETWNNGATVFGAPLQVAVTNTASASGSLLFNLLAGASGTTSEFSVDKTGSVTIAGGSINSFGAGFQSTDTSVQLRSIASLGWSATSVGGTTDLTLFRDAANTLALRNGTNPQKYCIYNTYTDALNNEFACFDWQATANTFTVNVGALGTGTNRTLVLTTAASSAVSLDAANLSIKRNFTFLSDNTYDIGANGANRPRSIFVAASGTFGGGINAGGAIATTNVISANVYTVSGLPACNVRDGSRASVSDASVAASGNFGAAVVGGGANHIPVYCDGTSWKIGQVVISPANDNLPPALREEAAKLWSAYG